MNDLPDICLLDINMPELNGFETAKQIKANWPQIKILAVSVYDSEFNIIEMLKAGANGYVLKDVQPVILRRAIENIYEQGYYHSELVAGKLLSQIVNKPAHAAITELSEKEIQFLAHCCTEMTYKEIAGEMGVSPRTVDGYRDNIFQKLNVKSRTGLVMYALKTGIAHF